MYVDGKHKKVKFPKKNVIPTIKKAKRRITNKQKNAERQKHFLAFHAESEKKTIIKNQTPSIIATLGS